MEDVELAALLCSRLCHDLVSPVGAITNGIEILEDDDDPDIRAQAISHIGQSAGVAAAKLQFMRVAFGSGTALGETIEIAELKDLTQGMFARTRVAVRWETIRGNLPREQAKLLLNLLLVAAETLPRGGEVTVVEEGGKLRLNSVGEGARVTEEARTMLSGRLNGSQPDPRSIVSFLTSRLARNAGMVVDWSEGKGSVSLTLQEA